MALEPEMIGSIKAPVEIAVGQGAVWVTSEPFGGDTTLVRIEPSTRAVVGSPMPLSGLHPRVAIGAGVLWVTHGPVVLRVDPNSGSIVGETRLQEGRWSSQIPAGITVGQDFVWLTNNDGNNVTRINARNGEPVGEPIRVGSCPRRLALGDGSVWVANVGLSGEPGTVTGIDAATGEVIADRLPVGAAGIAAGEGSIWVTDARRGLVTRLDPSSGEILGDPIEIEGRPIQVAVGEGAVWVTVIVSAKQKHVARIDPHSTDIVDRIPMSAGAITTGEGGVWVSLYDANAVARIQP